ncbi:MAG: cytochrome c [Armatimonadetes bacterium]|nr:cytochrome c [Armatimonadota bacterium]MDE2205664.1 cytochrome c [Armatimonadota bacterium]
MRNGRLSVALTAVLAVAAYVTLIAVAGCSKSPQAAGSAPGAGPAAGAGSATTGGAALFASSGCTRCHSMDGQGGRRAPDLTHVGANPQHTAQWIASYVKNPQSVDSSSRMPPMGGGNISDSNLQALGAYLATKK